MALQVRIVVGYVEIADLAFHGQGRLPPLVGGLFRIEMGQRERADRWIGRDVAVRGRVLAPLASG
jgi:hypothetical protein